MAASSIGIENHCQVASGMKDLKRIVGYMTFIRTCIFHFPSFQFCVFKIYKKLRKLNNLTFKLIE
jgi:hypothetical protein